MFIKYSYLFKLRGKEKDITPLERYAKINISFSGGGKHTV